MAHPRLRALFPRIIFAGAFAFRQFRFGLVVSAQPDFTVKTENKTRRSGFFTKLMLAH
jgi:hypothetical protein